MQNHSIKTILITCVRSVRSLLGKTKRRVIHILTRKRRERDASIIGNSCTAAYIYRDILKTEYKSPTIWMYFLTPDFILFATNLEEFIKHGVWNENIEQSREKEHPVGTLTCKYGSINVFFNHYKTFEEATRKWNQRAERINWNNINIVMNQTAYADCISNLEQTIADFDKIPYKKVWITNIQAKNTYVLENAFEQNDADVWNNGQFVRPNGDWAFAEYNLRKLLRRLKLQCQYHKTC